MALKRHCPYKQKNKRQKDMIPQTKSSSSSIASDAPLYIINCLLSYKRWILLDHLKLQFERK